MSLLRYVFSRAGEKTKISPLADQSSTWGNASVRCELRISKKCAGETDVHAENLQSSVVYFLLPVCGREKMNVMIAMGRSHETISGLPVIGFL